MSEIPNTLAQGRADPGSAADALVGLSISAGQPDQGSSADGGVRPTYRSVCVTHYTSSEMPRASSSGKSADHGAPQQLCIGQFGKAQNGRHREVCRVQRDAQRFSDAPVMRPNENQR